MSDYKQDEPNEGDEVVITYGKLKYMEKEIERLNKQLRVAEKKADANGDYIDRLSFCPDCRDKVLDRGCWRCEVQKRDREIERLKEADQMLFHVMQSINFSKNIDHNLPDVFDNQLCDGIKDYFRRKHGDVAK